MGEDVILSRFALPAGFQRFAQDVVGEEDLREEDSWEVDE